MSGGQEDVFCQLCGKLGAEWHGLHDCQEWTQVRRAVPWCESTVRRSRNATSGGGSVTTWFACAERNRIRRRSTPLATFLLRSFGLGAAK